jgi:hypothetical protein
MAQLRTSLVYGPALCVWNSASSFFTKDSVSIAIAPSTFQVSTDAFGPIDTREDSHQVVASMTPDGAWTAALVPELWPYANLPIGASIYGTFDVVTGVVADAGVSKPLVINGRDGAIHTLVNAAVTKMPDIILSANKTMLGSMEFTGLRGILTTDTAWATDASLYTQATTGGAAAFAGNTGFTTASIKTQAYSATWGSVAGFAAAAPLRSVDGFTVSFDMSTYDVSTDDLGVIDKRLNSVGVMVKCTPIGPTPLQIQAAQLYQNTGAARGKSIGVSANDFVITGADSTTVVTIKNARIVSHGFRFGSTVLREGEIGFVGVRAVTSGAQTSMWTLAPAS